MLTLYDIPYKEYLTIKKNKTSTHFLNNKNILLTHGSERGLLSVTDDELSVMLPFLDIIVCCYPRRVCQLYERLFPGISDKILHRWADIPVSAQLFRQQNGLWAYVILDYVPKKKEWQSLYYELEKQVRSISKSRATYNQLQCP